MIRTYTETYDLNTEVDCPTLLGIHSPIGRNPYHFLYPAFAMYTKYKYCGCDVTIVNASHLPVSPEAFAVTGGTSNVDPRDTLNPIMFKGCHGNSLGDVLDSMYGGLASDVFKKPSLDKEKFAETMENFYYTALGDDSWRKSAIQKTLRIRGLHPLVYNLATNLQIMPSNGSDSFDYGSYRENSSTNTASSENVPYQNGAPSDGISASAGAYRQPFTLTAGKFLDVTTGQYVNRLPQSMFTNKTTRLGWMDTQQISGNFTTSVPFDETKIAMLPKVFMGMLLLPPAKKAYTYLRVIIRHKFLFKNYRTITTGATDKTTSPNINVYGYDELYTGGVSVAKAKTLFLDETDMENLPYLDEDLEGVNDD